ncbi:thiolase family protein [Myroides fluvii]|uniref:thiolase family protein n=1 Tax=Myroides fluvii TaxID=2572594 RepID=UPI00131DB4B0|nr:thiolase family protein [Myroides fluvii]
MKEVFIIAAKRTPIGGFLGSLQPYAATDLGSVVTQSIVSDLDLPTTAIDSLYIGNGLSAGLGQAPARQVGILSGLSDQTDATTINKVCSSGLKAVALATQQIQLGQEHLVIAGGIESMSRVPFYSSFRQTHKLGHVTSIDGLLHDGLTDAYANIHMGKAAEIGIRHFNFTREELDTYALDSYQKAQQATEKGKFKAEIVALESRNKSNPTPIDRDEDIYKIIPEKLAQLAPVFEENGKLTAANSSNLNDGAALLLLASADAVATYNLKPIAKIIGYADAAQDPLWFTTAPALAIPKALKNTELTIEEIDLFEINEAYASVPLSVAQLLNIPLDRINIYGGAVALGHPIGASGARILVTLTHALQQENKRYGVAAICNGGGGATALVIEKI